MSKYCVQQRFGGDFKFFEDLDDAEQFARECLGFVLNTHDLPHTLVYDPVLRYTPDELEDILNDQFPYFDIEVHCRI